jgi:hypothetical protein
MLVRVLKLCLQFEVSEEDIDEIELGIRKWVVDCEWCIRPCPFRKKRRQLTPRIQPLMSLNNFQRARDTHPPPHSCWTT